MMDPNYIPTPQKDTLKGRIGQEIHKKVREIQELLATEGHNYAADIGEDNGFVYDFASVRISCQITSKKESAKHQDVCPADAYIGCKLIHAYPKYKFDLDGNGQPGYAVIYEDGYTSWSPKDVFEKAYLKIDAGKPIHQQEDLIDDFIHHESFNLGNPPLVNCEATTVTGATFSGGADIPSNDAYQATVDQVRDFCHSQVADSIDFVRLWAVNGLKHLKGIHVK